MMRQDQQQRMHIHIDGYFPNYDANEQTNNFHNENDLYFTVPSIPLSSMAASEASRNPPTNPGFPSV